jgi:protein-disulfide isomerase
MVRSRKSPTSYSFILGACVVIAGILFVARNHLPVNLSAVASSSVSNKAEIENIIKEYLEKNPQVIIESVKNMQERGIKEAQAKSNAMIVEKKQEIENVGNSPVLGNPKGDITIVQFYDYRCGYCKTADKTIQQLIENDKGIKFIYKEFPILGEDSELASKASLAVFHINTSKFMPFHNALMAAPKINRAVIDSIITEQGLDLDLVKEAMERPAIKEELDKIRTLANQVGISGTPAFVIEGELLPGAMSYESFKEKITQIRKNKHHK